MSILSTIQWIVSDFDPMADDADVAEHIRLRCEDARLRGRDIDDVREQDLVMEALKYHRENRAAHLAAYSLRD